MVFATGFVGHIFTNQAKKVKVSSQDEKQIVGELQQINLSIIELSHVVEHAFTKRLR